ncbi:hypothetical protein GYB61_11815 [bacterium]|nr:hypothetical protein [bacterium]
MSAIPQFGNWLSRRLQGSAAASNRRGYNAARHTDMAAEVWVIVRIFYAASLMVSFAFITPTLWKIAIAEPMLEPRWPVFWIHWVDVRLGATVLLIANMAAAFFAAPLYRKRWPRVALAITFFLSVALMLSRGYVNNSFHIWLWLTFFFAWLPDSDSRASLMDRRFRYDSVRVFVWATGTVLLFYTLSGIAKFIGAVPMNADKLSSVAPEALAHLVTKQLMISGDESVFGGLLVQLPTLGWPVYMLVIYIEIFALFALFRPALIPVFGWALMAFHIGIWFFMGILFPMQPLQVLLLLVWSPLALRPFSARGAIEQLPLLGSVVFWRRTKPNVSLMKFWWADEWPLFTVIAALTFLDVLPELVKRLLAAM